MCTGNSALPRAPSILSVLTVSLAPRVVTAAVAHQRLLLLLQHQQSKSRTIRKMKPLMVEPIARRVVEHDRWLLEVVRLVKDRLLQDSDTGV